MRIYGASSFAGRFDFNSFFARLDCIIRINALDKKVRMAVEVLVLDEDPGMHCETGCQHIRQDARHDCGPEHVVEPLKAS